MLGETVLLSQFNGDVNYLKIDLCAGSLQIISINETDKDEISFGVFECEESASGSNYVALLATPQGPLMFLNHLQLYLEIDKTKIEIKDRENSSDFLVLHEEESIFTKKIWNRPAPLR